MPEISYTKCRSCGAKIRYVVMPSGKLMPLDAEPNPAGNVFVHSDEKHAAVLGKEELASIPDEMWVLKHAFISHFATCHTAHKHRAKKKPVD